MSNGPSREDIFRLQTYLKKEYKKKMKKRIRRLSQKNQNMDKKDLEHPMLEMIDLLKIIRRYLDHALFGQYELTNSEFSNSLSQIIGSTRNIWLNSGDVYYGRYNLYGVEIIRIPCREKEDQSSVSYDGRSPHCWMPISQARSDQSYGPTPQRIGFADRGVDQTPLQSERMDLSREPNQTKPTMGDIQSVESLHSLNSKEKKVDPTNEGKNNLSIRKIHVPEGFYNFLNECTVFPGNYYYIYDVVESNIHYSIREPNCIVYLGAFPKLSYLKILLSPDRQTVYQCSRDEIQQLSLPSPQQLIKYPSLNPNDKLLVVSKALTIMEFEPQYSFRNFQWDPNSNGTILLGQDSASMKIYSIQLIHRTISIIPFFDDSMTIKSFQVIPSSGMMIAVVENVDDEKESLYLLDPMNGHSELIGPFRNSHFLICHETKRLLISNRKQNWKPQSVYVSLPPYAFNPISICSCGGSHCR